MKPETSRCLKKKEYAKISVPIGFTSLEQMKKKFNRQSANTCLPKWLC